MLLVLAGQFLSSSSASFLHPRLPQHYITCQSFSLNSKFSHRLLSSYPRSKRCQSCADLCRCIRLFHVLCSITWGVFEGLLFLPPLLPTPSFLLSFPNSKRDKSNTHPFESLERVGHNSSKLNAECKKALEEYAVEKKK